MCNIVSVGSSLISVKHLVEEQCFSKPSLTLETSSVDISAQQFLVDCTHHQHLCLYLNKLTVWVYSPLIATLKREWWMAPLPTIRSDAPLIFPLTFELAVWIEARVALYSYFLLIFLVCFSWWKKKTLRLFLMQICKMTLLITFG